MKQNKKWSMRIASFCLAGACLCGGAVLAAGGDESDPLVTLSYLTQTVTPNILKQVDEQAVLDTLGLAGNLETARLMELAARHDTAAALETLSRLLSTMSAGDRALFYRKYYYLQSTQQMAAELGTTARAVEGRLYRIRKKLQKQMGGELA